MILGTWIIGYSIFGMPKHIKDIKSYLGYVPIFCFNAANSKNATIYSLFAEQNSGDELVFFESEEYVKIDIVKWNKYVAGLAQRKKDVISLSDCFKVSDDKYCAYIVKEIKNELGKASLKNIVFGDYKINIDKEKLKFADNIDYEEYFNELYKGIKDTIEESFGEDWVKRKEIRPEDAIRLKESVVPKLFGYLYNSICGIDVGLTEDFDLLEYFFGDCVDRRVKLLDYNSNVEEKTYELFDGIYNDLNKCFSDSLNASYVKSHGIKAGRNDACPCGSGKKYKKCCGR